MSNDIQTALIILLVGMITVFVILALVVFTGAILIKIVNRFFAEVAAPPARLSRADQNAATLLSQDGQLSAAKVAAIVASVELLTDGKGKVKDISTK